MSRRPRHGVVIASLVMILGPMAACGDDSGSAQPTDGPTAAPSTTAGPLPAAVAAPAVPAPEGIPGVVLEQGQVPVHNNGDIDYPGPKPPSRGDHNDGVVPCGYFDQQVRDETAVHTLEHGAVWLAFAPPPAASAADIATIKTLVAANPRVLASPYAGLNKPVVLVAWERRLEVDSVNDPRVVQFITTYTTSGTSPEASVGC